jgi:hypothetical protein
VVSTTSIPIITSVISETLTASPVLEIVQSESESETPPEESQASAESTKEEIRRIAEQTVAEDLELWQLKFSKAADESALEIDARVDEISKRMIERHARTMGESLINELRDTATAQIDTLQKDIIKIAGKANGDLSASEEEITAAVRRAGLVIKEKAQDVRVWKDNYEMETQASVTKAAESHFRILAGIRDLAIQKVGMKWAWMDGITYKDWQKYHQLKDRLDEWTEELKTLITTHPGLEEAHAAAVEVEDRAMDEARSAAKELGRLKQVAAWKVIAMDSSGNFDSDAMEAAAESVMEATQQVASSVPPTSDDSETTINHSETIDGQSSQAIAPIQVNEIVSELVVSSVEPTAPEVAEVVTSLEPEAETSVVERDEHNPASESSSSALETPIIPIEPVVNEFQDELTSATISDTHSTLGREEIENTASDDAEAQIFAGQDEAIDEQDDASSAEPFDASSDSATGSASSVLSSAVAATAASFADEATVSASSIFTAGANTVNSVAQKATSAVSDGVEETEERAQPAHNEL